MEIRVLTIPTDSITVSGTRLSSAARHDQPDMLDLALRVGRNGNYLHRKTAETSRRRSMSLTSRATAPTF